MQNICSIDGMNWWIPSGKNIYLQNAETIADARQRFFACCDA